MNADYLEVTTHIGCKVNCLQYCPQERIVKKYAGCKRITTSRFDALTKTVPADSLIWFAGFVEPFTNPDAIEMIEHAHAAGHKVNISTTLVGLTEKNAWRLIKTPINILTLHLPDSQNNAKIPITNEYLEVLRIILEGVPNISFMSMNGMFVTNRNEDIARGIATRYHTGRVWCRFHDNAGYELMPDGNVTFCCMTRGLCENVGSLNTETYEQLLEKRDAIAKRLATDPNSICHYCTWAEPWWKHFAKSMLFKIGGFYA